MPRVKKGGKRNLVSLVSESKESKSVNIEYRSAESVEIQIPISEDGLSGTNLEDRVTIIVSRLHALTMHIEKLSFIPIDFASRANHVHVILFMSFPNDNYFELSSAWNLP